MDLLVKKPSECSECEIEAFVYLAKQGGQVANVGLESRVRSAEKLIFLYEVEKCVAIAALKRPLDSYKSRVFEAALLSTLQSDYVFEIGYIFSLRSGLGNKIMSGVCQATGGNRAFATTREDNDVMQYLLPKFGFKKSGKPYQSDSGGYSLGLFVKET